jgi:hypothetical protein
VLSGTVSGAPCTAVQDAGVFATTGVASLQLWLLPHPATAMTSAEESAREAVPIHVFMSFLQALLRTETSGPRA